MGAMGFDHATQQHISGSPSSPSSTSDSDNNITRAVDSEKENKWQDAIERRNTVDTVADDEDDENREGNQLKKTHTHHLGILKLRADDDDDPSDWWFASTAIPLIAATFAPMANVLSIAALVVSWRNNLTTDDPATSYSTSVGYADPRWCIDLNIASLICGFVGNLFLLFNFTKRVRYIVALPLTIVLFYFASAILIGITVSMHVHVPPGPGQVYSQGFWHAVIAGILYMFSSMILMGNMWGYFLGHYPQHFTLTDEQRNLILQTMMFFLWLAGGAAVFAHIEGWNYPDALYFCDVTILTIGFGDFYPTDDFGRGLVFPYSVFGTIILGLMVSSISRFAGELSKDKVLRKHVETRRINTLSRAVTINDDEEKRRGALERQIETDGPAAFKRRISAPLGRDGDASLDDKVKAQRLIGFHEPEKEQAAQDDSEPSANQFMNSKFRKSPLTRTFNIIAHPVRKVVTRSQKAILMREEKDRFDAMRNIQVNAASFKKWYSLMISFLAFGVLWCMGAVVFWRAEMYTQDMSYFRGLYFCYVSLLTIGYGDLSPKSNAGKPFFVLWSLIAVPTMTILVSDMGDTVISSFKQGTFRLADFTVLPKAGLWKGVVDSNPWLYHWLERRAEKARIKKGMPVGPPPEENTHIVLATKTIEQLAEEHLSDAQMTKELAFAIRHTADDLKQQTPKRYTFEEWVEFTRLMRFTKTDAGVKELERDEAEDGVVEWDWLAEDSPMLSEQSESEWILDRLCESLLRLLRRSHGVDEPEQTKRGLGAIDEDDIDPLTVLPPKKASPADDTQVTPRQEQRQRATGADALLTFFTGDRRGQNTYASNEPVWSKKALERINDQRRRSSTGGTRRMGPFRKLEHGGATGAVGGGRGGAGTRTQKTKVFGPPPSAGVEKRRRASSAQLT